LPEVSVRKLSKKFNDVFAVDNVSFDVKKGELVTLLGPSGCGKTTTLRCIGGLEKPDKGEITLDGKLLTSIDKGIFIPPEKRQMGMVFQTYAVWPNMTVYDNVAYGMKIRKLPKDEIEKKIKKILELVDLAGLEGRYPSQLSGGQQQRVAVARSVVYEPEILLLDEPLSNLDAKLREKTRFWLKEIQRKLGITSIYVTHDQTEAMVLSDRIIVMNHGRIEQEGPPLEIYDKPHTPFVADFIGVTNMLYGSVASIPRVGHYEFTMDGMDKQIYLSSKEILSLKERDRVLISVRPSMIDIYGSEPPSEVNVLKGKIEHVADVGDHIEYWVSVNSKELRVWTTTSFGRDKQIYLKIPSEGCAIVPLHKTNR